jgi:hypothetical protein
MAIPLARHVKIVIIAATAMLEVLAESAGNSKYPKTKLLITLQHQENTLIKINARP